MAHGQEFIDISNNPDLLRLAEDVRRKDVRVVLGMKDTPLVAIVPLTNDDERPTRSFAGLTAAAGSWQDEDTDTMFADILADRLRSVCSPVAFGIV